MYTAHRILLQYYRKIRRNIFNDNQYIEMTYTTNEQYLLDFIKLEYKIVRIHEILCMNNIA